jgi:hypothetical protein
MKDTDFEYDSRAHSFWKEWQGAADRAGDSDSWLNYIGQETPAMLPVPESFSEAVASSSPDWDFVVNGTTENDLVINLT